MIGLGVAYQDNIETLLADPELGMQHITVYGYRGEDHDAEDKEMRATLKRCTLLYHYSSVITPRNGDPETALATLQTWQQRTRSPWLSVHLDCYADDDLRAKVREGVPLPEFNDDQALEMICAAVHTVQARLPGPLLLENVDFWPILPTNVATQPGSIRRVLDETGCGLLLDTAHARISAAALGQDIYDYLGQVPLERTVELHVSGPRVRKGRLADCHDSLQEEDYEVLRWVLQRCRPQAVTLEFWDPAELRNQLLALRRLLDER